MAEKPNRIQLKRTKGWRMPPNTVKVDRSTRWGNPSRRVELYRLLMAGDDHADVLLELANDD